MLTNADLYLALAVGAFSALLLLPFIPKGPQS